MDSPLIALVHQKYDWNMSRLRPRSGDVTLPLGQGSLSVLLNHNFFQNGQTKYQLGSSISFETEQDKQDMVDEIIKLLRCGFTSWVLEDIQRIGKVMRRSISSQLRSNRRSRSKLSNDDPLSLSSLFTSV